MDKCKSRSELKNSGVYFLIGNDANSDKEIVYVGQAITIKNGEGVLFRVNEHQNDSHEDYWNEAIIITIFTNTLGPTEISYLEHTLYINAKEAGRCIVKNV